MRVRIDYAAIKKLRKELAKLGEEKTKKFVEGATKELAARLLAKVKEKTPVGDYSGDVYIKTRGKNKGQEGRRKYKTVSFRTAGGKHAVFRASVAGKLGGTLRRGWAVQEGEWSGRRYAVQLINPVEYALYVEYGHRKRGGRGWVDGRFMLSLSLKELRGEMGGILKNRFRRFLEPHVSFTK